MMPLDRRRLRIGHPPQAIPLSDEPEGWDEEEAEGEALRSRRQDVDPIFGYIIAMALSLGLTPIQVNTRYVALWALLGAMGGMAFLLGSSGNHQKATDPGDLLWGIGLGIFAGGALLLVGQDTLAVTSTRLFGGGHEDNPLLNTWIIQTTVFVMPMAESLFFRGALQRVQPMPVVAVLATIWSILMFFPNLGLSETPVVGLVIGVALALLNFLYSYVNFRHGLAASFLCQVCAGTLVLLVPRLIV
jgi:hypothetical protein